MKRSKYPCRIDRPKACSLRRVSNFTRECTDLHSYSKKKARESLTAKGAVNEVELTRAQVGLKKKEIPSHSYPLRTQRDPSVNASRSDVASLERRNTRQHHQPNMNSGKL